MSCTGFTERQKRQLPLIVTEPAEIENKKALMCQQTRKKASGIRSRNTGNK